MSSLLYLGVSVVVFFILFGFLSMITPIILGTFLGVLDTVIIPSKTWTTIYNQNKELVELLVPLTFSIGLVIGILKIFMSVTNRGRD